MARTERGRSKEEQPRNAWWNNNAPSSMTSCWRWRPGLMQPKRWPTTPRHAWRLSKKRVGAWPRAWTVAHRWACARSPAARGHAPGPWLARSDRDVPPARRYGQFGRVSRTAGLLSAHDAGRTGISTAPNRGSVTKRTRLHPSPKCPVLARARCAEQEGGSPEACRVLGRFDPRRDAPGGCPRSTGAAGGCLRSDRRSDPGPGAGTGGDPGRDPGTSACTASGPSDGPACAGRRAAERPGAASAAGGRSTP